LTPPADCLDDAYLTARYASADPSLQAELGALKSRAEQAHASRSEDIQTVVVPALADLRRRAEAADQPALAAEAVRLQATAAIYRDDDESAERHHEDAFFLAELAGDHRSAFAIAIDASMLGGIVGEPAHMQRWNERARALLELVSTPQRELELAIRDADVLLAETRPEDALDVLERAEPLFEDADDEMWARYLDKRAQARLATHDTRGAGEDWALGLRLLEDALGPEHPEVLTPLNGLAITEIMLKENEAAATHLERALAVEQEKDTTRHALLLANLALLHEEMGELERAVAELLEVDRIFEQHLGHAHPQSIRTAVNLARVYELLERIPEAQRYAKRALANAGEFPVPYREDLERLVVTQAARSTP
jgi:tetratricopeptide (TPR) repeat protein